MSEKEHWKDIPSNPRYQVSTLGRVRSKSVRVKSIGGDTRLSKGKLLSPRINSKGEHSYVLYFEGRKILSTLEALQWDAGHP